MVLLPGNSNLHEEFRRLNTDVYSNDSIVTVPRSFSPIVQTRYLASLFQSARYLGDFIKINDIDLIHTNMEACWVGGLAATYAKKPAICHLRSIGALHPSIVGNLTAVILNTFNDLILSTSNEVKRQYEKAGLNPRKIMTIYNGLNVDIFNPETTTSTLKNELCLEQDKPLIGMIANFDHRKGHHDFVNACAIIHKRHPTAKFVIVGSTSLTADHTYYDNIKEMADNLGLARQLVLLGARNDIPQILKSLDVVVQPSLTEAGPRVPLETMAMERPIVVTDAGGTSEEVINEETGLVVPIGDVKAIANATIRLLSDRGLCKRLGKAGRQRVLKTFTDEICASKIQEVYRQVLNKQI
jgi:glycosyltransferase involved in cell wall biosynthesis